MSKKSIDFYKDRHSNRARHSSGISASVKNLIYLSVSAASRALVRASGVNRTPCRARHSPPMSSTPKKSPVMAASVMTDPSVLTENLMSPAVS